VSRRSGRYGLARVGKVRTDKGWRRFYATGWLASAAMTAVAFHRWRVYVREVEYRASEAERTREVVARERAMEERLRIARDLHDSLTHSISVIKVQSGVAVHLARKRGEEVPAALLAIHEASSDASRELRATLEVLRREEPAPVGADGLAGLLTRFRASGLEVTATVEADLPGIPREVAATVYRIVQESLTNVARHAGASKASVVVRRTPTAVTVLVENPGAVLPRPPVPGLGLIGMRERVAALGGQMIAQPRVTGGFCVHARLPVAAK
jgi:signal transduction histidine kinase